MTRSRKASIAAALAVAMGLLVTGVGGARAVADTGCSYYANQNGFGYACGLYTNGDGGSPPRTWKQILADYGKGPQDFVPCRILKIDPNIRQALPAPKKPGTTVQLVETMSKYDLDAQPPGGHPEMTYGYAELTPEQIARCQPTDWMITYFWNTPDATEYTTPQLGISPIQTPRVNTVTSFSLAAGTDEVNNYTNDSYTIVRMRGAVKRMEIIFDPTSGEGSVSCNVVQPPPGPPGTKALTAGCNHTFKHTSAKYPDHLLKMTIVEYWKVDHFSKGGSAWIQVKSNEPGGFYKVTWHWQIPVQSDQGVISGG